MLEKVCAEITSDTEVVVGHSLGSVVAYEALCALAGHDVHALITLGSPLGIRRLVFDQLQPAPIRGKGVWPGAGVRWTNICDRHDVVALEEQLSGLLGDGDPSVTDIPPSPAPGEEADVIHDQTVDNGWRAHDLLRWRAENEITGVYTVPYDMEVEVGATKAFPLGQWVHQQRKACGPGSWRTGARTSPTHRRPRWSESPVRRRGKPSSPRCGSYRQATEHLAPRQDAVRDEGEAMVLVGQHMTNLRPKGTKNGLGKDPERAAAHAAQLTETDPDWDCP
ncbi:lipase family protein [Streptomyces antibioticus]|uniref:hypothetical protein n=1 Tax=Streptomyces antibioticus TaxID=1890 RepID=UPI0036DD8149